MSSPFSSRLGTNYRPTDDEILAIQEIIASDTNAAQQIDKQVQGILESIAGSILARDERISSAKKHAAFLHPIRKVPEDILSAIFHRCIPHDPSDAPVTRHHPSVILSHVCQDWRQLILSAPSLWAEINLILPEYPNRRSAHSSASPVPAPVLQEAGQRWISAVRQRLIATNTWIERSRDHPLSIVFVVSQPITSVDVGSGFWGSVSAGLETICKVAHRWKRVQIRLSTIEPDSESLVGFMLDPLLNLKAEDVPLLESLSMNSFQSSVFGDHMGDSLLVPTTNVLRAPSLRSLRLEYISVSWRKLPVQWAGLNELRLSSNMADSYGVIDAGVELFGATQAFALLKTCQNLVRCDLALAARSHEGQSPMKDPDGVALLPNLKHLTIRGPIPGTGFFRGLLVPSLTSLSFTYAVSDRNFKDELLVWVEHIGHQLATLALHFSALREDAARSILKGLPNIRILDIRYRDAYRDQNAAHRGSALIRLLTDGVPQEGGKAVDEGRVCLCPQLRHFICSAVEKPGAVTESEVLEMIASRSVPGRRAAVLESVSVSFGVLQTLDIRKELEARGVDVVRLQYKPTYPSRLPLKAPNDHWRPMDYLDFDDVAAFSP